MTVAPARGTGDGAERRIGDILLELGFVGEEALAKAAVEQERSGLPLGQILVEQGAITRLELASALAEHWSDQVSITPLPGPTAAPRVVPRQRRHPDKDQYAARLQEAVADLTQRVRLAETENPLDSRLVELAERVEATVARTQRLEATVATLVENLEGMTSGVEEAFSVLQSGMSGLAMDLARMETTLSDRPLVDEDARGRADELAARLEALADRASLEQVEGSLDRLRSSLDAQLERLDTRLNEYGAAAADTTAVESLTGRLDAALEASLGAIDERLALLAQDLASRADASLAEHLATVEGRLATLVSGEDLSLALERTREELASMTPESDPRVDDLARELTSVRDELHEATAARLDAIEARLQAELASSTDPEAAKALAALSERIEELSRERHAQEELAAKLAALESRLPTDTVTAGDLAAAVEELRAEQAPAADVDVGLDVDAALDDAVASLTEKLSLLEELQTRVDALAETVAADPAAPAGRDEELRRELEERLATIASTVDEKLAAAGRQPSAAPGLPQGIEDDIERFRMTLERINMHLADHDRTLSEMRSARGVPQRLDELAAQVESLATGIAAAPDGAAHRREPGFSRDLEPNEMRQLIRRIEDSEKAAHEGREKLMNQLERMASSIDWRLQRLEADEPSD